MPAPSAQPFSIELVARPVLILCESQRAMLDPDKLYSHLALLVDVANGTVDRQTADAAFVEHVMEALRHVCLTLFSAPKTDHVSIPFTFWTEPGLGRVCSEVIQWAHGDDVITFTEAAQLLYADADQQSQAALVARIRRLVAAGTLESYPAIRTERGGQPHGVLRSAVLAYKAASSATS